MTASQRFGRWFTDLKINHDLWLGYQEQDNRITITTTSGKITAYNLTRSQAKAWLEGYVASQLDREWKVASGWITKPLEDVKAGGEITLPAGNYDVYFPMGKEVKS